MIHTVEHTSVASVFAERHYSVKELAEAWNFSPDTIRSIFEREPGVLVIGNTTSRTKRRYRTLSIPESVAERATGACQTPSTQNTLYDRAMLTIYRRHKPTCSHAARRAVAALALFGLTCFRGY
jgi:hypothetical protein